MEDKKPNLKFDFRTKEKKTWEPHHYHINFLLILCIILVIFIFILLKYAFVGYKFSQQFKELGLSSADYLKQLDETKNKLTIEHTNLAACEGSKKSVLNDLSAEKNNIVVCRDNIQSLNTKIDGLRNEYNYNLTKIKDSFELEKDKLLNNNTEQKLKASMLEKNFDSLAANVANSVCCKQKVDDKKIDSYVILNNAVICTSGEEKKIGC